MQAHGAAQGVGTAAMPRRGGRWFAALLAAAAILVILAVMALTTRGVDAPASGGVAARDAEAGAVVHDDAGNMPLTGAGAAIVHDDAGNVKPR